MKNVISFDCAVACGDLSLLLISNRVKVVFFFYILSLETNFLFVLYLLLIVLFARCLLFL